jgi:hypothetical protein
MSSPSSPTLVATKRFTCKKVKKRGCNTRSINIYTGAGRDIKKLTRIIKKGPNFRLYLTRREFFNDRTHLVP